MCRAYWSSREIGCPSVQCYAHKCEHATSAVLSYSNKAGSGGSSCMNTLWPLLCSISECSPNTRNENGAGALIILPNVCVTRRSRSAVTSFSALVFANETERFALEEYSLKPNTECSTRRVNRAIEKAKGESYRVPNRPSAPRVRGGGHTPRQPNTQFMYTQPRWLFVGMYTDYTRVPLYT